jgi:hypothetical protein
MLDVKYSIASTFYDLDFIVKSFDKSTGGRANALKFLLE